MEGVPALEEHNQIPNSLDSISDGEVCRRCKGRGRVLFLRPWFLVVCLVALALAGWWRHEPGKSWLSCSDFSLGIVVIVWGLCGGLWSDCPVCTTNLTDQERLRRYRQVVEKDFARRRWGDRLLLGLLPPLYKSVIHPFNELGAAHREQVLTFVNRRIARSFWFWLLPLFSLKCLFAAVAIVWISFHFGFPFLLVVLSIGTVVFIGWALAFGFLRLVRSIARDCVRDYLGGFFEVVCGRCGYIVRGLPLPRCPECGTVIDAPRGRKSSRVDPVDAR